MASEGTVELVTTRRKRVRFGQIFLLLKMKTKQELCVLLVEEKYHMVTTS